MKQNSVDSILDEDFNFHELKQTVKSLKIQLLDRIILQMK